MEKFNTLSSLLDMDTSDMSNQEQRRFMNQLKEAICDVKVQLQSSREMRESIDKDIQRLISGAATWTFTVQQAAKLGIKTAALRELVVERKRAIALARQLEEQEGALSSGGGASTAAGPNHQSNIQPITAEEGTSAGGQVLRQGVSETAAKKKQKCNKVKLF
ncbi:hypothetical protein AAFF_G00211410 [Aldrovandia affinis]|uniref:Uncharacterized protein n=1 Tax=Aldrovandia affinis TaxID=143900 RepID=A0AAD7WV45_9TELE|nr:hypothetical protein AAFF_G00211410 [Aldrovandia affinis]